MALSSNPDISPSIFSNIKLLTCEHPAAPEGTLKITTTHLEWTPMLEENAHWNTALVEVNLHAISTDASSGHPACIYAQIGNEYDEIRLIPSGDDAVSLNTLYEALCVAVEQNTTDENLDDSIAPFLRAGDEAYAEAGDSDGQARALPGAEAMLARLDALVGESTAANGVDDKEEDTES